MKVLRILLLFSACIMEYSNACNSYYDGQGLFGDGYMNGHPHVHAHQGHGHHGYYNRHGYSGYSGFGGLMDSMFRTDINGGSHGHHHHSHSSLMPMSHHRHVHRVYRRSVHVSYHVDLTRQRPPHPIMYDHHKPSGFPNVHLNNHHQMHPQLLLFGLLSSLLESLTLFRVINLVFIAFFNYYIHYMDGFGHDYFDSDYDHQHYHVNNPYKFTDLLCYNFVHLLTYRGFL